MKTEKENSRPLCFLPSKKRDALAAKKAFTPLEKASDFSAGYKSVVESGGIKLPSSFVGERNSLTGFTLAEILTVIVIIAILVGILMPSLSQVKKLAAATKQKAQIGSIEMALELYKNDFGEYPPSHGSDTGTICGSSRAYCGAQTLAEAMFGQDLLGFYPDSRYDPCDPCYTSTTIGVRRDPYLDRTNISVFRPRDIFNRDTCSEFLAPRKYTICDVFTTVSRQITLPDGSIRTYKIGTPVLYFRANPSPVNTELIPNQSKNADNIYDWWDNYFLLCLGKITDGGKKHPLCPGDPPSSEAKDGRMFYGYIRDPMIPILTSGNCGRPVRPDSFILISAGPDGLYGTRDDICNFEPNLPG